MHFCADFHAGPGKAYLIFFLFNKIWIAIYYYLYTYFDINSVSIYLLGKFQRENEANKFLIEARRDLCGLCVRASKD